MKKIFIISGGTLNYVSPHFAFCAPAYGQVGVKIYDKLTEQIENASGPNPKYSVELIPTQMALHSLPIDMVSDYKHHMKESGIGKLETNDDLSRFIDYLITLPETRCIIMAAAVCDFEPTSMAADDSNADNGPFGKVHSRLSSSHGYLMHISPSEKLIPKIRQKRKDIFVVSFKTTAGVGRDETYKTGLLSLKKNSSNLVFANDIKDKINMVITPEEFPYEGKDRQEAIDLLAEITFKRLNLTFEDKTILKDDKRAFPEELIKENAIPNNWFEVMNYLFENNAFKPLPGTGKTSGHFGCRVKGKDYERITSERKINHNESFERGMIPVYSYKNGELLVGGAKPSVGEKTQEMIYHEFGDKIHAIVHFHCPLKHGELDAIIPVKEQFPYECGSLECSRNTTGGIVEIETGIYAVHLRNHGPNIAFHESVPAEQVIKFINKYWNLKDKTGGIIKDTPKESVVA